MLLAPAADENLQLDRAGKIHGGVFIGARPFLGPRKFVARHYGFHALLLLPPDHL